MNEDLQAVLFAGLDMALAEQTAKLFGVLCAAHEPDRTEALQRFARGLGKVIEMYDTARQMTRLGPEDEDPS
jgi:hypothetical protein